MVLKEKEILKFLLFVWLSLIKVSGFVVFNEGKKLDSLDSFDDNARAKESFDRGHEELKSGEQVGRLLVWQDQTSHSRGDGRFSSDVGFQSRSDGNSFQSDDSGGMEPRRLWGQVYALDTPLTPTVERLLEMKPRVDCVGGLMTLTVHGRDAPFGSHVLIDRGNTPPLPLSQLPSVCGQKFLRTWRDFVFIIPYNGCYVSQERDTFVLPLLWWGLSVKMSCSSPTLKPRAPTVSCYRNGMIVKLHRGFSENMKIKVMNEWQPLLKGSVNCGYSLVSHAEGLVLRAPYLPCTEPKDGVFTLSMAAENEFNLSCPALSLDLLSLPDHAPMNCTPSMLRALVSATRPRTITSTTQPISSEVQKLHSTSLPYYIPGQQNFKPVPPSYPFLLFPPNVPPTAVPRGRKIVHSPTAVTQQPQAPVYIKYPQTWYPWNPKPNLGLIPVPGQSTALPYPREPLLPPTKTPKTHLAPLLNPTTMPVVPPVPWMPMFPPRNLVYPLSSEKLGFGAPSSKDFPQDPHWINFQNQPEPSRSPPKSESAPPTPAPTRKAEPQLFHSWYKPFPPHYSVMPPVPAKVPQSNTVSTTYQSVKSPPMSLESDFSPRTFLPKSPEVDAPAPTHACLTPFCLSHAHSQVPQIPHFWYSGPPSVSYHHHNHQYFGHQPMFNFKASTRTKIKGQMLPSPVTSEDSTQFPLQGMDYNYGQFSSEGEIVPPASESTAVRYLAEDPIKGPSNFRKFESANALDFAPVTHTLVPSKLTSRQNGPVAEPLVYSNESPKNGVYQAEMEPYVPPWGRDTQAVLVAPNVPFFEQTVQSDISFKPTMRPAQGENVFVNRWYQAASNAMSPVSDYPTEDTFSQLSFLQPSNRNSFEPSTTPPQPEQSSGGNFPVTNSRQHNPQSGDSVFPVLSSTYWVPAV